MRQINPKINGYSNEGRLRALAQRQERARQLIVARSKRTPLEQLALLDSRPGQALRERARLERKS